jgi:thiol-disulfide isomerase/thioredoxin
MAKEDQFPYCILAAALAALIAYFIFSSMNQGLYEGAFFNPRGFKEAIEEMENDALQAWNRIRGVTEIVEDYEQNVHDKWVEVTSYVDNSSEIPPGSLRDILSAIEQYMETVLALVGLTAARAAARPDGDEADVTRDLQMGLAAEHQVMIDNIKGLGIEMSELAEICRRVVALLLAIIPSELCTGDTENYDICSQISLANEAISQFDCSSAIGAVTGSCPQIEDINIMDRPCVISNPGTGCADQAAPEGTPCSNDGFIVTKNHTCKDGVCMGRNWNKDPVETGQPSGDIGNLNLQTRLWDNEFFEPGGGGCIEDCSASANQEQCRIDQNDNCGPGANQGPGGPPSGEGIGWYPWSDGSAEGAVQGAALQVQELWDLSKPSQPWSGGVDKVDIILNAQQMDPNRSRITEGFANLPLTPIDGAYKLLLDQGSSGPKAPQMPSGPKAPQMPSGPKAPQMPSGPKAPQMPSGPTPSVSTENKGNVELTMVGAEWCGYTKKAMGDFEKVKAKHDGKNINGYEISVNYIEADENKEMVKKMGVNGFPTLMLAKNGEEVTRDLPRDAEGLGKTIDKVTSN